MSQTKWSERQKRWRQEVIAKAREREQKRSEEVEQKEQEQKGKWERVIERLKELKEKLSHLEGVPVKYDGGEGVIAVSWVDFMENWKSWKEEDNLEDPAEEQEAGWLRVHIAGKDYVCCHIGISYGRAELLMNGRRVAEQWTIGVAEKWVEEHAYGSTCEEGK